MTCRSKRCELDADHSHDLKPTRLACSPRDDGTLSPGIASLVLLAAFVLGTPIDAAAPVVPRLVLRADGPVAPIRAMSFSNDSTRLYAAGLDKVVHAWQVGWNQDANASTPPQVTYTGPIVWELARGNRGIINAMAVHPRGAEMVLGGVGARQQTGDLVVVDLAQESVVTSLPLPQARAVAARDGRIGTAGHVDAVVAIDYSPSGDRIATRDERGGLFLWRRAAEGKMEGRRLIQPSTTASRFALPALFLDDQTLVYSRLRADGDCQLVRRRLLGGGEVVFPEPYPRRVAALVRDPRGKFWASADALGHVNITSLSDPNRRTQLTTTLPEITAMAAGGDDRLAVVSTESVDGRPGRTVLDWFDVATRQRLATFEVGGRELSRAVAVSPNGRFIASVREDDREILVWQVESDDQPLDPAALKSVAPAVATSASVPVRRLAISVQGDQLGWSDRADATQFPYSLDLQTGDISTIGLLSGGTESIPEVPAEPAREQPPWRMAQEEIDGWRFALEGSPTDTLRLIDQRPRGDGTGEVTWTIRLDPTWQGYYRTHCFLMDPDQPDRPIGVAVGTEHVDGIFLYHFADSPPAGGAAESPAESGRRRTPELVRWYRDHSGAITTLIPSLDQQTLFSGSEDRTIKMWSLAEAFEPTGRAADRFNQASFWGCDFRVEAGQVRVRQVNADGIAHARSLRDGDSILRVQGYDRERPNQIIEARVDLDRPNQADAAKMIATLNRVSPLRQVLVEAMPAADDGAGPGENPDQKAFIIRPAWEPLLTLFADDRGEWAIWTPDGYFNASAAEGGDLFQWLINRGQDQPPRLLAGGSLSKRFERPDIIQKLLSGIAAAAALAADDVAAEDLATTIAGIPEVQIVSPSAEQSIASDVPLTVTAMVNFGDADSDAYELRATMDAIRLGPPKLRSVGENQVEATWQLDDPPTGQLNQIHVLATERNGALASFYSGDVAFRRGSSTRPTPYRLHVLSLASEEYRGPIAEARNGFGRLDYPVDDVDSVLDTLRKKQQLGQGTYRLGEVTRLQDAEITVDAVGSAIDAMNQQIDATDGPQVLVLYLSGHGTTVDGQYFYVNTSAESPEEETLRRQAIPWSLLARAGRPGCQVIAMIDTCHAGTVVDAKSRIRDPARHGCLVLAAASGRNPAKEYPALGHGCFTFFVLLAMEGRADGSLAQSDDTSQSDDRRQGAGGLDANGIVEVEELMAYVRREVTKLTGSQQVPTATPSRLADVLRLPLVRTSGGGESTGGGVD